MNVQWCTFKVTFITSCISVSHFLTFHVLSLTFETEIVRYRTVLHILTHFANIPWHLSHIEFWSKYCSCSRGDWRAQNCSLWGTRTAPFRMAWGKDPVGSNLKIGKLCIRGTFLVPKMVGKVISRVYFMIGSALLGAQGNMIYDGSLSKFSSVW